MIPSIPAQREFPRGARRLKIVLLDSQGPKWTWESSSTISSSSTMQRFSGCRCLGVRHCPLRLLQSYRRDRPSCPFRLSLRRGPQRSRRRERRHSRHHVILRWRGSSCVSHSYALRRASGIGARFLSTPCLIEPRITNGRSPKLRPHLDTPPRTARLFLRLRQTGHAHVRSRLRNGVERMRLPVA